jgi:hypothetical protein
MKTKKKKWVILGQEKQRANKIQIKGKKEREKETEKQKQSPKRDFKPGTKKRG